MPPVGSPDCEIACAARRQPRTIVVVVVTARCSGTAMSRFASRGSPVLDSAVSKAGPILIPTGFDRTDSPLPGNLLLGLRPQPVEDDADRGLRRRRVRNHVEKA